ncbi:UvrD-helicase domain-containing protein [Anaerofilum sp. BX8]|uniref:DNA 3'-5' helicase n=1 Tax=Anaerofilum hominis TaxID=2763016 RepID=A0A923I6T5_9FIRM|nr:UvrD-helicase domain-containing protein [Anaerofilum hominis]MBC5580199.1 UvrD-helicase domain-containing protein [Anaerofilum hominis]
MSSELEKRFLSLRKQVIEASFGRLNPVQRDAVFTVNGPLLILAGAGSGKTTVLVNRIANLVRYGTAHDSDKIFGTAGEEDVAALEALLKDGGKLTARLASLLSVNAVRPWHVLAITFTNKAAGELKTRLEAMLGSDAQDIAASTFHSACVRILRREAEHLGYPKSFTIYDSDDSLRAMKEVYKQYNIDDKFLPVKSALSAIGRLKDQMVSPAAAAAQASEYRTKLVATAYEGYAKRLFSAGALDFDDLIYQTVLLFQEHPDVLEYYRDRWQYILVDEYQDTSVAQFLLVSLLAGGHNNICVVGDDDQSIYRFRGATIENILSFEQHFPGAKVVRLEQNYRSTTSILDAANRVIKNNVGRKGKTLWTDNGEGDRVCLYRADNEQDEAAHIASVIGQNLKNGAHLRDHAVLYRMNAQSGPIETYFARAGIPYKIVGGHRFFDRKEVKDIISYLSVIANPRDDLRLRRIINEPARKIGAATLDAAAGIAAGLGCGLMEVIAEAQNYPALGRALVPLKNFCAICDDLTAAAQEQPLDELVSTVIDRSGYRQMLEAQGEEGRTRLENLGELVSSVKTYADEKGDEASLEGYLEEVALISDIDGYDEEADTVVMMTMHAAKGLEFDYVFLVGLEEGVFPGEMSRYSDEDLEEERRLCYVGITRAKKELYLSCARTRMIFGQTKRNPESRFLTEIGEGELQVEESPVAAMATTRISAGAARQRETTRQAESFRSFTARSGLTGTAPRPTAAAKRGAGIAFKPGDLVEHKVFGRGTVLKVTPIAGDTIVEIRFDTAGVKKTMANYAPLTLAH